MTQGRWQMSLRERVQVCSREEWEADSHHGCCAVWLLGRANALRSTLRIALKLCQSEILEAACRWRVIATCMPPLLLLHCYRAGKASSRTATPSAFSDAFPC